MSQQPKDQCVEHIEHGFTQQTAKELGQHVTSTAIGDKELVPVGVQEVAPRVDVGQVANDQRVQHVILLERRQHVHPPEQGTHEQHEGPVGHIMPVPGRRRGQMVVSFQLSAIANRGATCNILRPCG